MTSQGSPYARYRRAIETGNPTIALAAAAELPTVGLTDALSLVLVLAAAADRRFEAAVVRWHGRYVCEVRGVGADESLMVLAGLRGLGGPSWRSAAAAVGGLLEARGQAEAARVVDEWADLREC